MNYRAQIERLIPKAETGEQWAEICRLEQLAVEEEQRYCDCGNALCSEQEERNNVCDECL